MRKKRLGRQKTFRRKNNQKKGRCGLRESTKRPRKKPGKTKIVNKTAIKKREKAQIHLRPPYRGGENGPESTTGVKKKKKRR